MKHRTSFPILAAALVMLAGLAAWGGSTPGSTTGVESRAYLHSYNLASSGVALEGYCPVTYHAVNKAIRGKPQYASTFNGVTYHLASADARKAFESDPERYIPAFGGWCAFGMSIQDKFPVDPTNFKIVNGRLMVFLNNQNIDALELWKQGSEAELIAKAAAHWKKVSG